MHRVLTLVPLAALAGSVQAEVVTVRTDLTEAALGFFGIQYSADSLSEQIPGTVVGTRLHLNFNTSGIGGDFNDAANLYIQMQPPTENLPIWSVSGADLGWSGQGSFTADITSDVFDGEQMLIPPDPNAFVLYFYRIVNLDDANPALGGQLTGSYWEVDIETVPTPATLAVVVIGAAPLARRRRR